MSFLVNILPSFSTVFTLCTVFAIFVAVWILQGVSFETLTAFVRLYVQGSVQLGSFSIRELACRDIVVKQPRHLGSHVVLTAKSISLHPSWRVFKGEPLKVIIDRPWVNGVADDQGQLQAVLLLQDAGLLREVRAVKKPGCPVCGPRGDAYDQECHCTAGHAAGKEARRAERKEARAHKGDSKHFQHVPPGSTDSEKSAPEHHGFRHHLFHRHRHKAEGEDDSAHGTPREDSPRTAQGSSRGEGQAPHGSDDCREPTAHAVTERRSGSSPLQSQRFSETMVEGMQAASIDPETDQQGAGKAEYSAEDEGLCEQQLSGTIKLPFVNIQLADGALVVHEEIGQVFGGYVKVDFFLTALIVNQAAKANGIDHSWTKQAPESSQLTGRPIQPFALRLETEHLSLRASGWRTTTGFLLRQPASATVTFTPALAKYGLARLHPLLAHAMSLKESNSVTAAVTPLAMHIPFEAMTIRVTPLKLQIKGNKIIRGAIRLIEFRKKAGKGGKLECWTSAIEADVYRTGELVSKRMDVLISRDFRVSKAPLHMAMWGHGRLDVDEGSIIDAVVAIPAYTLSMAGLCGLPNDYMLQIGARGSAYSPSIDWLRATKTLTAMLVERNVPSLGIKGVRRWLDKRCEERVAREGPIPAPTQPLPWDHFRRMPHRLNASRHLAAYVSSSISDAPQDDANGDSSGAGLEAHAMGAQAADMGGTMEEHPDADHAAGIAAVPQSDNAPLLPPGAPSGAHAPDQDSPQQHGDGSIPGTRSLHAAHTMSSQLAQELQSQERERRGCSGVPEEDDIGSEAGTQTDTDDEDWLVEEEGRLVPGKSTLKISQLSHEA